MPLYKFTARSMPKPPASGRIDYWDKGLPSFGQRVSASGHRTWIVMYRYNAVKRRMKLGGYPAKGLADARDEAKEVLRQAEKGGDPAAIRRANRARMETVDDLADAYIEEHAKRKKRSWKSDQNILKGEVRPAIGRKRLADVTRQDVRSILQPIVDRGAEVRANRVLEVVRKMFNWAIAEKDEPIVNPAAKIPKPGREDSRRRYLTRDELVRFWRALDPKLIGEAGASAFRLLLLTAQREMEVVRMRWEDLDLTDEFLWTIPADIAKNELEHVIPLPPAAVWELGLLKQALPGQPQHPTGPVFPSPKYPNENVRRVFIEKRIIKIRKAAGIEDVNTHDLRRTVTTYFGKLRVQQFIKKKILNHAKRKKSDVTEIYDRFEYIGEKRQALVKWEKLLLAVVGEEFDTDGLADCLFADDEFGEIAIDQVGAS